MIPHKLQLKNFLSYGAQLQTVDFSGHRLICLSGKNGHGKSALLDAITWAIWGQARKISGSSKADAHLLRLGSSHMLVAFEFYFNNTLYKIRREFTKQVNKAIAQLDFAIFDQVTNSFKPLTDKTIRDTQELITHTLGLSFDGFINSAFLRQGHSNEFSKRSAQERKEILSNILGLQQYEELRKRLVEENRELHTTLYALEQEYAGLQTQTADGAKHAEELTTLSDAITKHQALLEEYESRSHTLNQELGTIQQEMAYANQLQKEKEDLAQKLSLESKNLLLKVREWRKKRLLFSLKKNPNKDARRQELHTLISALHTKQSYSITLREQSLNLRTQLQSYCANREAQLRQEIGQNELLVGQLQAQEQLVQTQHQHIYSTVLELTEQEKSLRISLSSAESELKNAEKGIKNLPVIKAQFEKRKSYFHQWASRAQSMHKEIEQIRHKLELTQGAANPCCPLCEQNLSASRKKYLRAKLMEHESPLKHQLARLKKAGNCLKDILIAQHSELQSLQKKADEAALLQQKYLDFTTELDKIILKKNSLQKEIELLNKAFLETQEMLAAAQKDSKSLANKLTTLFTEDIFYKQTHEALEQIEQELSGLASLTEQITAYQNELNQLAQPESLTNKQIEAIHKEQLDIGHTLRKLQEQKKVLINMVRELGQSTTLALKQKELIVTQNSFDSERKKIQSQLTEYASHKGALEQQLLYLKQIVELMAKKKEYIADIKQLVEDKQILAQAFGKDGIQALLIEEALPEIEQEANALLQQLTDNQAHIIIDSLRDLKKGGAKETLDIKISDSLGIRPYELFSGGEAFRIDFALRIALAKLLANRSGTSLQTLIIDEGFGSQDEDGLTHIMDALYRIQDHFSKIIIVSHLPAMKDQFPVHFMIEKGAQGSSVRILEQG